jgi:AraC family transcriptional regulator of arabinose operon
VIIVAMPDPDPDPGALAEPPAMAGLPPIRVFYADPPILSADLAIHALGTRERMRPCIVNRPAGTGDYLLMCFHGEVELWQDGQPQLMPGRTMVVWDPGSGHYYGNRTRPWWHSWIHCAGATVAALLRASGLPCNTPINGIDPMLLEAGIEGIHREITGNVLPDEVVIANLLHNVLRQVARARQAPGGPSAVPPAYLELRRWLEAHFTERITLEELAQRVHCSVPHFCNEFKRHFASSAIEFVIRLRLSRATMLLRDRNHRIGDIARAIGYDDIHHFSKLFSKHLGCSPRTMRKRLATGG